MTMNDLELTEQQIKAIKSVERSIKKAQKLGVEFWFNYEQLAAYNNKKITQPIPDRGAGEYVLSGYIETDKTEYDPSYTLNVGRFSTNADDPLYYDKR